MRWSLMGRLMRESSVSHPREKGQRGDVGRDVPVCAVFDAGSTSIVSSLALRLRERSPLSLVVETGLLPLSLDGGVGWEIGNM